MTWDATTPQGSEAISLGDNRIRELKTDIATALTAEGTFPGSDTANPVFIYTPAAGNTAARPATNLYTGRLYINTQLLQLERYSGGWAGLDLVPLAAIDATKLAASVAGNGLAGGAGTALSVNVDTTTIEISSDTLRIAASAAGSGLSGGGGSALSVNVDDSSIEINADTLRVKAGGITEAMLATAVVNKLGQSIGIVARASHTTTSTSLTDALNISTRGRLMGVIHDYNNSPQNSQYDVIVDGVTVHDSGSVAADGHPEYNDANSTTICKEVASQGNGAELMMFFRTSLQVRHRCTPSAVTNDIIYIQYEREA